MDDESIKQIVAEIQPLLVGRFPGKIFQLDAVTLVIDFRLSDHRSLLVSVNPSRPRIHLVNRRLRELEKQRIPLGQFALSLRKQLSNSRLVSIAKEPADRIVRFEFAGEDDTNRLTHLTVIAQLTGRSANLFLVSPEGVITQRLRATHISGQQIGEPYKPPISGDQKRSKEETELLKLIESGRFSSPSDAAEAYYQSLNCEKEFDHKAGVARARLKTETTRQKRLLKKLKDDLASHADAEHHKRIGELLLANVSTAKRSGKRATLIDYFESNGAPVEIEIDEQSTLPEEATRRFGLYSRSKRAVAQINSRIEATRKQLNELQSQQKNLEEIITKRDVAAFAALSQPPTAGVSRGASPLAWASAGERRSVTPALAGGQKRIPGTRRYVSSDGFEILVGRASKDNDYLTFKVARPNDLWLHSTDYAGSHVVVRNPTRKEVPHRTIIEAAQLAAHFSRANKDSKVDVHYTQRKFLSKPKGAAPGLVRMSRCKNITVEPKESITRL